MKRENLDVIILGAPRSGTNILRDVLTSFDKVATWPCDEINYIWRHGNITYPSDEMPDYLATPKVVKYVNNSFQNLRRRCKSELVVEKTCANSLRVPFVERILPDAKYLFIYRDGIDASYSASLRWKASLDISYVLRKSRYIPVVDVPYYFTKYAWSRFYKLFSIDDRIATWGPVTDDLGESLKSHSLIETCALQWQKCVERTVEGLKGIEQDRICSIQYERFVQNPLSEISRIARFLKIKVSQVELESAVRNVSDTSIGKGRESLSELQLTGVKKLIRQSLLELGYED